MLYRLNEKSGGWKDCLTNISDSNLLPNGEYRVTLHKLSDYIKSAGYKDGTRITVKDSWLTKVEVKKLKLKDFLREE